MSGGSKADVRDGRIIAFAQLIAALRRQMIDARRVFSWTSCVRATHAGQGGRALLSTLL